MIKKYLYVNNYIMRKSKLELPIVKFEISLLQGKRVKMLVHRGRKKYSRYTGVLEGIYPSIFTVRIDDPVACEVLSYSYSDVVCGEVRLQLA